MMFPYHPSTTNHPLNLLTIHNRRLLLHSSLYNHPPQPSPSVPPPPATTQAAAKGFDANAIMVLSVLLCALFCSLGLNSIVRCALNCSTFVNRNQSNGTSDGENRRIRTVALDNSAHGGVTKKALKAFPTVSLSADLDLPGLDTECVICLSVFVPGERVRLLPNCNHGFHVTCIDTWLGSHASCPTCRSCLVETCHHKVLLSQPGLAQGPTQAATREVGVNVMALEGGDTIHMNGNDNS